MRCMSFKITGILPLVILMFAGRTVWGQLNNEVAYWDFDQGVYGTQDVIEEHGWDGFLGEFETVDDRDPTWVTSGKTGNALLFDKPGAFQTDYGNYLTIPQKNGTLPGCGATRLVLEADIFIDPDTESRPVWEQFVIIHAAAYSWNSGQEERDSIPDSGQELYALWHTPGGYVYFMVGEKNLHWHQIYSNDPVVGANAWHHIKAEFDDDADLMKIFVDGTQITNITEEKSPGAGTQFGVYGPIPELGLTPLQIGRFYSDNPNSGNDPWSGFYGRIDNVKISTNVPSDLVATAISSSEINLTWTDNSGDETGFEVWRKPEGGDWLMVTDLVAASAGVGGTVEYLDTGLATETTYYYTVGAYKTVGDDVAYYRSSPYPSATTNMVGNNPPAPTADPNPIITDENNSGTSQVSPNDPDAGDTHTYGIETQPKNGSASVDASGLATYTPNTNFSGSDSFVVRVTDNGGLYGDVTIDAVVNIVSTSQGFNVNNIPTEYDLLQNYPNPFNPETIIKYRIPQKGLVSLTIYNARGQEVSKLINEVQSGGEYSVVWNGEDKNGLEATSGIYFYCLMANEFISIKKMVLIR